MREGKNLFNQLFLLFLRFFMQFYDESLCLTKTTGQQEEFKTLKHLLCKQDSFWQGFENRASQHHFLIVGV